MNERNVAALTAALETAWAVTFQGVPIPVAELKEWKGFAPFLALSLAARGVLVPSALTQDDIAAGRGLFGGIEWSVTAAEVASLLERIAKV